MKIVSGFFLPLVKSLKRFLTHLRFSELNSIESTESIEFVENYF